jgi:hypothetical protein
LNKTTNRCFGSTTQKALDHGLRVDILAPTPTPSMTMALKNTLPKLIKENNFTLLHSITNGFFFYQNII